MEKIIEHEGIVEHIEGARVVVTILQASACSSCAAAALCHSSETKEKTVEAIAESGQQLEIGQRVVVQGQMKLGLQATVLAYIVPLTVMMVVLAVVQSLTGSDTYAALAALTALAACYFVLWLCRHRLQRRFVFRVQELKL
ncbi:MAG: SoxR reducing system RseC family protein [Bacteroidaceae bacterium]|nr:SoxR reducing system RseC family protein [Bacteroidaceae bacterium]